MEYEDEQRGGAWDMHKNCRARGDGARSGARCWSSRGDMLLVVEGGLRVWSVRTCRGAGCGACT